MSTPLSGIKLFTNNTTRNNVETYYSKFDKYRKSETKRIKEEKEQIEKEKEQIEKDRSRLETIIQKKATKLLNKLEEMNTDTNYNLDEIIIRIEKWGDIFNYVDPIVAIKPYSKNTIDSLMEWINKGMKKFYSKELKTMLMGNIQMNCTKNGDNWECTKDNSVVSGGKQSGGKHKSRKYKPRKPRKYKSRKPGKYKSRKSRKSRKMYGGAQQIARCKCTVKDAPVQTAPGALAQGAPVGAQTVGLAQAQGAPKKTFRNKMRNKYESLSTKKENITAEILALPQMDIDEGYISSQPFDDKKMKQLIKYMYDNATIIGNDEIDKKFFQAYEKIQKETLPFTYDDNGIKQKYNTIKKTQRGPGIINRFTRKKSQVIAPVVLPPIVSEEEESSIFATSDSELRRLSPLPFSGELSLLSTNTPFDTDTDYFW